MKKNEEAAQVEIPAGASITNPSRRLVRLRGSHSSQQEIIARRPGDEEPEDPEDPEDPVPDEDPPPPPVSTPDLAIQLLVCLPTELQGKLVSAIRQEVGTNADVRVACINNTQRIGVWLRPPVGRDNEARELGLEKLNILVTGQTMALFVNASLIRRRAFDRWNLTPKRLNGDMREDPSGPVHLTGYQVIFQSPDKLITHIDGFDERPWPDVSFRLTTTDTLSADARVNIDRQGTLDVDTSWLNFLTGLFLITLPPLGAVFLIQRIIIAMKDAPEVEADTGVAPSLLELIPKEILISGGQKVVAFYDDVQVSDGGVFLAGGVEISARTPRVTITGPTQISVVEGTPSLTKHYTLHTEDLLPPFHGNGASTGVALSAGVGGTTPPRPKIVWSGEGVPLRPKAETTEFRFDLEGAQVGQVITRRVSVQVVDSDGLSASAELVVRIHVTPEASEDFPKICQLKPWLAQCQEPMEHATSLRGRKK